MDDDHERAIFSRLLQGVAALALPTPSHANPMATGGWFFENSNGVNEERAGYVRLDVLFGFCSFGPEGFSREEIEAHVVALKGHRSSKPTYDVRLPFAEGSSMIRLLTHFIGDGAAYPVVGSSKTSSYTNKNASLRQGFIACLTDVFGDVSRCVSEKTSDENRAHVKVPKWIPYMLAHFYPDAQFGQLKSRLPSVIFSLPRELQIEAVRTLADDDGSVQELCIRFVSGSRTLLKDARRLVLQLVKGDKELSEAQKDDLANSVSTVRQQRNWYRLDVGFPAFEWYHRTIGFSHPEKARELEFRIRAAERTKNLDALARDFLIFSALLNCQRTAQEIALTHLIREEYVHESLRYHLGLNRVSKVGKSFRRKKASAKWALTEEGRNWFQTLSLVNRDRRKDSMRKTLPERDCLRYRLLRLGLSPDRDQVFVRASS